MICLEIYFRLLQLSYFCLKNMRTCLNRYTKGLPEENFTKTSHELDSCLAATVSACFEAKGARVGNLILCLYNYIYVLNCPKNCLKTATNIYSRNSKSVYGFHYNITLC